MVLVGLYVAFGRIGAMMMGCHNFEVDTFTMHEDFETSGALVVKHLKDGAQATVQGSM